MFFEDIFITKRYLEPDSSYSCNELAIYDEAHSYNSISDESVQYVQRKLNGGYFLCNFQRMNAYIFNLPIEFNVLENCLSL